jgi:hypothetical protein
MAVLENDAIFSWPLQIEIEGPVAARKVVWMRK